MSDPAVAGRTATVRLAEACPGKSPAQRPGRRRLSYTTIGATSRRRCGRRRPVALRLLANCEPTRLPQALQATATASTNEPPRIRLSQREERSPDIALATVDAPSPNIL